MTGMTAMIPYAEAGTNRLDTAYVKCFNLIPDDEWLCVLDHDVMFTRKDWHSVFERLLPQAEADGYGILTCTLSCTPCPDQRVQDTVLRDRTGSSDLAEQWYIGSRMAEMPDKIEPVSGGIPAVSVISKRAAKECGVLELPWDKAFYGADTWLHGPIVDAGYKHGIVRSIYAYHRYNANIDRGGRSHDRYYEELEAEMLQR